MSKTIRYEFTTPGAYVYPIYCEMADATHLLVSGTTGSGKSTVLNALISTEMIRKTPASVQFVLIDPKRVELNRFRNVSRFCVSYADSSSDSVRVLDWVIAEMDRRYKEMQSSGLKFFSGKKMIVCIDELADLMISADAKRFKAQLQKITQLGRAANIAVWAATQAPNRRVIPAEVTLNFTDKVALRCVSAVESRQIVQVSGAEKLPRHGKALYLNADGVKSVAVPYVSDVFVQSIIGYWKTNPGVEVSSGWFGKETRKTIC